ncbi:NADP-dependent oxidoreductase [Virgisporangium aliadipatigenens]|uniref:NADP-dependent oxidoreductase n=1 Tax=Virgisporangium aliadipatigenens TaxID=741659 RepID=A0A8J4DWK0_9ACTN|nr:NADP-dependent oxidoreductase [Virgisporangium aliadipatigenens]GIJ51192.1 NADP-dependent oxidoreductase [Virgisporangium aliadipatigenens]
MSGKAREIHLASRPQGWPTADNFAHVQVELPEPAEGEVLVRNLFMSVDPYMRGRMNDVKSYVAPFQLDRPMEGGAIGEVVASNSADLAVGDTVTHNYGWRDHAVAPAKHFRKVDPTAPPTLTAYLGVLGMPGLTAYAGLTEVAGFKEGDAVFVSGAAGAVGSVVGQIARALGASRVVGSAGSAAKVSRLLELGFDAAFDYHDGPVRDLLKAAAPEGIDVYFDNVGGDHLEAAIGRMRLHGRIAVCGMISVYNATEPVPAPRNLSLLIGKRITMRGFLVQDHARLMKEFVPRMAGWLRDGTVRYDETVVDGLDNAPEAFLGLLRGENTGKMVVRI